MDDKESKIKVICLGDNEAEFSKFDPTSYQYFATNDIFTSSDNQDASNNEAKLAELLESWAKDKQLRDVPVALGEIKQFNNEPDLFKQLVRHTVIYNERNRLSVEYSALLELAAAVPVDFQDANSIKVVLKYVIFGRQNGFRLAPDSLEVANQFNGLIERQGRISVTATADFNKQKGHQVFTVKMTNYLPKDSYWDFIPEVDVEGELSLDDVYFKIFLIREGSLEVIDQQIVTNKELAAGYIFYSGETTVYLATALYVKGGKGTVRLGQIHVRKSHLQQGKMILGGTSVDDSQQNVAGEILTYFNPGDFKPPLNVYFSGYRTLEGFEGQRMMHGMGSPFLLIADSRLEGGAFYMGNPELEHKVVDIIKKTAQKLGFKHNQIVMSGLSMGTFASLYYAADIRPAAVIVGKPLVNIGDVALNERINRPEGFPTALDVLMNTVGEVNQAAAQKLNERFWTKFNEGMLQQTKFFISYMENDDYDLNAFPQLYEQLKARYPNIQIIHRGFIGRHNDDTAGIVTAFFRHYDFVLSHEFGRIMKKGED